MFNRALAAAALIATATFTAQGSAAQADFPGAHPFYRHALADLREARGLIDVKSFARGVDGNEDAALDAIDRAIGDIKRAGIDDGKPMQYGVAPDGGIDHRGRLHRALQALRKARSDADREEQNPSALGLRRRATRDIDIAIAHDKRAIYDVRAAM